MGPSEVMQQVGKIALELRLPSDLASVHSVIQVSILMKCIGDPESILPIEGLGVYENIYYEGFLVKILDRQMKRLRSKLLAS